MTFWLSNREGGASFLERLRAAGPPPDRQRGERVLAVARALLAFCSLAAAYVDSPKPEAYSDLTLGLLFGYVGYSLLLLAAGQFFRSTSRFVVVVHAFDLLWPVVLTAVTTGPSSPFFLFFLFALLAAAYRWGLRETMLSGALGSLILIAEAALPWVFPGSPMIETEFELNRLIIRATYLLVVSFLIGYLAEDEKLLRAEAAAAKHLLAQLHADRSLRHNLQTAFDELMRLFGSRRLVLAVWEPANERLVLWNAARDQQAGTVTLQFAESAASEAPNYLFLKQEGAWTFVPAGAPARRPGAVAHPDGAAWPGLHARREWLAFSRSGKPLPPPARTVLDRLLAHHPCDSMTGAHFGSGREWQAALLLLDPIPADEKALRFLTALLQEVGPAAYNVYLLRRLRSRAGAMERTRVARELHDGVLQSLIALEMEMDVLRAHSAVPVQVETELGSMQQQLRGAVLDVRELMQQMRPVEMQPGEFLDFVGDTVQRFQRETGIRARFVTDLDDAPLSPRVCREVGRILQEALVNVRKHSAAGSVIVRFERDNGRWRLSIQDDGSGFDFYGTMNQNELDVNRKGPAVIKERLRSIRGELAIESRPGHGSRLDIYFPGSHG